MLGVIIRISSLMKNLVYFARALARAKHQDGANSLIRLSLVGIALSVALVHIAFSIIIGFKGRVSSMAYSQTGQISLMHYGEAWTNTTSFIQLDASTRRYLLAQPEVKHLCPVVQQMAMLKTKDNYSGLMLYGLDEEGFVGSDLSALLPDSLHRVLWQSTSSRPIILPRKQAEQMGLSVGDKVMLYFVGSKVQLRPFDLVGLYETAGLEHMPALATATALRKIARLDSTDVSRILLGLHDTEGSAEVADALYQRFMGQREHPMSNYAMSTAEELLPELFSWLALLDSNVVFLVVVILLIACFTMIAVVIILVLDKTRHIGILKAIGADDWYIRRIFVLLSVRLVLWGILAGNLVAALLLGLQHYLQPIKLNPRDYFMDTVPVAFDLWVWLAINLAALVLITLSVVFPTRVIAAVRPSEVMRFD